MLAAAVSYVWKASVLSVRSCSMFSKIVALLIANSYLPFMNHAASEL